MRMKASMSTRMDGSLRMWCCSGERCPPLWVSEVPAPKPWIPRLAQGWGWAATHSLPLTSFSPSLHLLQPDNGLGRESH